MKNFSLKSLLILVCVFSAISSCHRENNAFNIYAEKQLVEKAIHNSIGWAKTKDINLLYSVIANDTNYIEIDPNDRVVKGFQEFKRAEQFWMNPDFIAVRYEIKDLIINFSKTGDVA